MAPRTPAAKKGSASMPITDSFLTYNSKMDPYNMPQSYLSVGSQNVLISDLEKFSIRGGIEYQTGSVAGLSGSSIPSSTEWQDSTGDEWVIRALAAEKILQVFINGSYETLMDSLESTDLIFSPYFDSTEEIDRLLWCDGTTNAFDWSGGVAELASITATTVTLQGTETFGQLRFLTTGTRAIRIKDDAGVWHRTTYTAGEDSETLSGLGTDLTGFSFTQNNLIVQEVITYANYVSSTFDVDFLQVIQNQVWAGSRSSNSIYVSKNTAVADFTFSSPRLTGEGAQLTLDGPGRAVGVLRGDVMLFGGGGYIYKSVFQQITVDLILAETLQVVRLKTTDRQGAQHQNLLEEFGDGLAWIGNDNVLYQLLDATIAYNPKLAPLSDPVKPDFDAVDFTGGHLRFCKNRLLISAPASNVCFIYEYRLSQSLQEIWFWQPPQVIPVNRWAIISDSVCGHSSQASETYELFTGYRDLNGPIHAIALLGRWNGGYRSMPKHVDEMFNEGVASANTKIDVTYMFDLDGGVQQNIYETIEPLRQKDTVYTSSQDPSLGNLALGDYSLSGDVNTMMGLPRFRVIHEINEQEIIDYGVRFETNGLDQQWEILCHGSNAELSTTKLTALGV